MPSFDLSRHGITCAEVWRNPAPALLYEHAVRDDGGQIADSGALIASSGAKTGRSPKDRRIVEHPASAGDVWWGETNIPLSAAGFAANRQRAVEFLSSRPRLYVIDAFAGWDQEYRLKVRVICARPYHALFMHNMLIRPTAEELADFGEPDYVIFNAGQHFADDKLPGMTSPTSVDLNFEKREFVILGTEYAGEMKKGVFTIMNYLMPKAGALSMHCSANEGASTGGMASREGGMASRAAGRHESAPVAEHASERDVTLFFGLSGTGKTTLSADPRRSLIGDDEHVWTSRGVFNIEGGCYAKCLGLKPETEPQIYDAIRFGSVLENVDFDETTRTVDFDGKSKTENTRVSYPLEFIPGVKLPAVGGHPANIIFLTCDAFGVLPPVSRLSPEQAMYHFISGYTAKVAGTEMGVTQPVATFSACFGAAFLIWHPTKYAELLAAQMKRHHAAAWLVNTGWSGGGYGVGQRMKLAFTRAIIDAIHDGSLAAAPTSEDPIFAFDVPTECPRVPSEVLIPRNTWRDTSAYDAAADNLARLFHKNFTLYTTYASPVLRAAGPRV